VKIHKGTAELDVQPHRVATYERKGWKRGSASKPKSGKGPSRKQLNEQAREAGVEAPEKLPNKAAVEAAIAEQA
jgi:hypothetical protein